MEISFTGDAAADYLPFDKKHFGRVADLVAQAVSTEVAERSKSWKYFCQARPRTLSLVFCDDAYIRSVNRQYRKLDKATDVLSFPTFEMMSEDDVMRFQKSLSLGDLLISTQTVKRAAQRMKRPFRFELLEVYIHGLLHLWGFDHIRKKGCGTKEIQRMRSLQSALFCEAKIGIKSKL